jgi:hypothetical protein
VQPFLLYIIEAAAAPLPTTTMVKMQRQLQQQRAPTSTMSSVAQYTV